MTGCVRPFTVTTGWCEPSDSWRHQVRRDPLCSAAVGTGLKRPARLPFLVALDVVLEMDAGIQRPVLLLRLVFEVDFGALHRDVLHGGGRLAGTARIDA